MLVLPSTLLLNGTLFLYSLFAAHCRGRSYDRRYSRSRSPLYSRGRSPSRSYSRCVLSPCILVIQYRLTHFSLTQFKFAWLIGLFHLQIPNTGLESGPTPAHLLTADQEAGAPTRRNTADPHEERGLSLLPDEVVLMSS